MDKLNMSELGLALKEAFEAGQIKDDQYVIGIFNKHTNELLGYHLSTVCQRTNDILEAKRYSGDNPYNQLAIIADNIKYLFDEYPHEGFLSDMSNTIRKSYGELTADDIYIDAIYLAPDTPAQQFKFLLIEKL